MTKAEAQRWNNCNRRHPRTTKWRRRLAKSLSSAWRIGDLPTKVAGAARIAVATFAVHTRRLKRPRFVLLLVVLLFSLLAALLPLGERRESEAVAGAVAGRSNGAHNDGGFSVMMPILWRIFKRSTDARRRPLRSNYLDCSDAFLHTGSANAYECASQSNRDGFCVTWEVNMDPFWMMHWTTWKIGAQNRTHQCFDRIRDAHHLRVLHSLATVQFPPGDKSVPESVLIKKHTGSGWGVDWAHVVDGLLYAVNHNTVPVVVVSPKDWKYASSSFDATSAGGGTQTSTARDFHSLVLPTHNLTIDAADLRSNEPIRFLQAWRGFASTPTTLHVLEFATRSQTWLRGEGATLASQAYPGMKLMPSSAPNSFCITFHVRRGDVVLHGKHSRRYHAIAEYVDAYQQERTNRESFWSAESNLIDLDEVLLITDDANAIAEAQTLHPKLRWRYVPRPRHRGSEGGWENPIPSGNSTLEVVVLQALEQLLRFQGRVCDVPVLVHSKSNLADYLYAHLLMANPNAVRIDLDQQDPRRVHSVENAKSVELSRSEW
jgi:hypothetical protein